MLKSQKDASLSMIVPFKFSSQMYMEEEEKFCTWVELAPFQTLFFDLSLFPGLSPLPFIPHPVVNSHILRISAHVPSHVNALSGSAFGNRSLAYDSNRIPLEDQE